MAMLAVIGLFDQDVTGDPNVIFPGKPFLHGGYQHGGDMRTVLDETIVAARRVCLMGVYVLRASGAEDMDKNAIDTAVKDELPEQFKKLSKYRYWTTMSYA